MSQTSASISTSPVVTLREARSDDVEAIAALHAEAWHHGYLDLCGGQETYDEIAPQLPGIWAKTIAADDELVLVAEVDGQLAGVCAAAPAMPGDGGDRARELTCYVDPDVWRTGVASTLAEEMFDRLRDSGVVLAVAWLIEGNKRCLELLRSLGFSPAAVMTLGERGYRCVRFELNL